MASGHNLFVSYDLHVPGQNYAEVIEAIKSLGSWARVHYSLYFVDSQYDVEAAAAHVWKKMDPNDKLLVIDATTNMAVGRNIDSVAWNHVLAHWNGRARAA